MTDLRQQVLAALRDFDAIVVRPSVARKPIRGKLATIEKILVDLHVECRSLPLMDMAEYRRTFDNLIRSQRIDVSVFTKYAERRNVPVDELLT